MRKKFRIVTALASFDFDDDLAGDKKLLAKEKMKRWPDPEPSRVQAELLQENAASFVSIFDP